MKKNLSNLDRVIRVILGTVLIGIALRIGGPVGILVGLAAIGLLVNAAMGVCGLYRMFGISTCKIK
jgi:tetrahydromethanopterin S-methyltransferase subunit G